MLDFFWCSLSHRPNRLAKSAPVRSGVLSRPKDRDYTVTLEGLTSTGSLRFLIHRHLCYACVYPMHRVNFMRQASAIVRH